MKEVEAEDEMKAVLLAAGEGDQAFAHNGDAS